MIIHVAANGTVELQDANEFKSFKVAVATSGASTAFIAGALKGIAAVEPDGKTAWVSQQALRQWRGLPQPQEWLAAFDKMVESVRRFGWVRDADQSVRAHIEMADA
ncbi:MAG TPA: hypothetical protein VMU87_17120 [Stellaceae bacterium]|nr:hypothetical protein [Stellaceae bacterium]